MRSNQTDDLIFENVTVLARALRISETKVYAGIRAGVIPHIRLGRRIILPKAAIEDWLRNAGGRVEITA